MNTTRAFAPANVSCIFCVVEQGSLGLGFTVNEGVTAEVSLAKKTELLWNNQSIVLPTVSTVLSLLAAPPLRVSLSANLPLGSGFGLSGAAALSSAYAVGSLLNLRQSERELAGIAHVAEVTNQTGLGDVVNQWHGGMCLKMVSSARFQVIPVSVHPTTVYCHSYGKLLTSSVLTNTSIQQAITTAAMPALKQVEQIVQTKKSIPLAKVLTLSKQFVESSGLLTDTATKQTIAEIESRGGHASMIILGKAVMSDLPFPWSTELTISSQNAHLL